MELWAGPDPEVEEETVIDLVEQLALNSPVLMLFYVVVATIFLRIYSFSLADFRFFKTQIIGGI